MFAWNQIGAINVFRLRWNVCGRTKMKDYSIVGSVKVNFLSYRYRVDKSTIFGMRGLWGLTINSRRGATLKYL